MTKRDVKIVQINKISIHTTRVGGDGNYIVYHNNGEIISIHTTRVGGDQQKSTFNTEKIISIHTTRVGGDHNPIIPNTGGGNFNPHHPCGWWPATELLNHTLQTAFQSTPPVWVVTFPNGPILPSCLHISIHTTRVGGDTHLFNPLFYSYLFQSTPPVWVVTK